MMPLLLNISLFLLISYLIGAIPFGFIVGKLVKKIDVRQHGSGNIGATNVMRVLGVKLGLLVLLLDIFKGFFAVYIARYMGYIVDDWWFLVMGFTCILGHIYTVFLGFKGGKGVATACGVTMALMPMPFLAALFVFIIIVAFTRFVSLGSISAAIMLSFTITMQYIISSNEYSYKYIYYMIFSYILTLFIILKHKANISRLIKGTENKLSFKKKN